MQDIKPIIAELKREYSWLREYHFPLYKFGEHVKNGDIIFEQDAVAEDAPIEVLLKQAHYCNGILEIYKGFHDEFGKLHIINARNLLGLINQVHALNESNDVPIMTVRRLNLAQVHIYCVEHGPNQIQHCVDIGMKLA